MTPKGRKILKWSILGLLLAYTAGMGIWANREARIHLCTGIEVDVAGQGALDSVIRHGVSEELRKYPKPIIGTLIHQINTAEIERYLSKYNNFESVNCMISSRGQLIVKITPLIPVMRVFFGDNSYYINKDGKHISSNAEFYNEVPVVTGRFNRKFTPKDVIPLVNFVNKDAMLHDLVSMIVAEDASNLILVPRIRGHVVNFGDTTRLDEKKRTLTMFYRQVMPYKGWEEYDTISVKFRGQVVATRRDKTRLNHMEEYEEEVDLEEATLPDGGGVGTATAESGSERSGEGEGTSEVVKKTEGDQHKPEVEKKKAEGEKKVERPSGNKEGKKGDKKGNGPKEKKQE